MEGGFLYRAAYSCASDLFVFMCVVFVQLGRGVFVTHLLLLCAVICVPSLVPR